MLCLGDGHSIVCLLRSYDDFTSVLFLTICGYRHHLIKLCDLGAFWGGYGTPLEGQLLEVSDGDHSLIV